MSNSSSAKGRRGIHWIGWGFLLVAVFLGYTAIRNILDWNGYTKGHRAYLAADCTQAIKYFDSVIHGWRPADMGKFAARAQTEKSECVPFQQAVDEQQAGKPDLALLAYMDFMSKYRNSPLSGVAHSNVTAIFTNVMPTSLATQETCPEIETMVQQSLIPQQDLYLPPFYFACGKVYDSANSGQKSFDMYKTLLMEYPNHALASDAEKSLLENPLSCERSDSFKDNGIAQRIDFMPSLYYHCGQGYDSTGSQKKSYAMYKSLLTEYPNYSLAAEAEKLLIENPSSCGDSDSLKTSLIAERTDFMPSLYYHCGPVYEGQQNWEKAIAVYEDFLAAYPSHALAPEMEAGLARSIVAQSQSTSAGEIPTPERSGYTGNTQTVVEIQNDSPERLRIVFSGPESRVEELDACSSCTDYTGVGPLYCPEQGPIGRYTLSPGQYDIVVESISASDITPWTGNWSLVSGDEYYDCFITVTTLVP